MEQWPGAAIGGAIFYLRSTRRWEALDLSASAPLFKMGEGFGPCATKKLKIRRNTAILLSINTNTGSRVFMR